MATPADGSILQDDAAGFLLPTIQQQVPSADNSSVAFESEGIDEGIKAACLYLGPIIQEYEIRAARDLRTKVARLPEAQRLSGRNNSDMFPARPLFFSTILRAAVHDNDLEGMDAPTDA
jgi:hypothetical protein